MDNNNTFNIVGTSFFVGVILAAGITFYLTMPHYGYSQSMEILTKHGMATVVDGTLYYTADGRMSRMEVHALAKMSDVYAIEIDIVSFDEDVNFSDDGQD